MSIEHPAPKLNFGHDPPLPFFSHMATRGSSDLMTADSASFFKENDPPTHFVRTLSNLAHFKHVTQYDCDAESKYTTTSQRFVGQSALNFVEM